MVDTKKLKRPTPDLVRKYLKKYKKNNKYTDSDKTIRQLIQQNPTNKKITDIFLKATFINDISSTQIFDIYQVADHIKDKKIDARLKKGSPDLVDDIARVTIGGRRRRLF